MYRERTSACFLGRYDIQPGAWPGYTLWLFQHKHAEHEQCPHGMVCGKGWSFPAAVNLSLLPHLLGKGADSKGLNRDGKAWRKR